MLTNIDDILREIKKLFPKKDRYSLGQKIDNFSLDTFEFIILAGTNEKEKKLPFIEKAIVRLDILKILIRLAKDINAIESKKYLELESILQEIGRMLGGWKKSLLSPKQY